MITHKSSRLRESDVLDECVPEILRCAQDDSQGACHPEHIHCAQCKLREGSLADSWVITSEEACPPR